MFFCYFLQETQVPGLPCKWYTQSTIFGIPVNRLLKKGAQLTHGPSLAERTTCVK